MGMAWHYETAKWVAKNVCDHIHDRPITYASGCSGIDMFATALHHVTNGKWTYKFASEPDNNARDVLYSTYKHNGLDMKRIHGDVECKEAMNEDSVNLFVLTPPCGAFSSQNRKPQRKKQANELARIRMALRYVSLARPNVVVIENVTHPTVTTPISAEVARIEKYEWERRVICPSLHLGCPVKRPRMVWIGVREQ